MVILARVMVHTVKFFPPSDPKLVSLGKDRLALGPTGQSHGQKLFTCRSGPPTYPAIIKVVI